MCHSIIDAHIHLDLYDNNERARILQDMNKYRVDALISVSKNKLSSERNLELSRKNPCIKPAFGYHPEQDLPEEKDIVALLDFIKQHQEHMVAIGEVGLPYYLRKNNIIPLEPYMYLLEVFIQQAANLNKPIVLHAIYEDAATVCTLLEKYSIKKAHFHWFKGDEHTIERMIQNNYFISITPDVLYEGEIQRLVKSYPLSHMMVETDGPWPFEGSFRNKQTHPMMIHQTVNKIALIKNMDNAGVYQVLYENTKRFYGI